MTIKAHWSPEAESEAGYPVAGAREPLSEGVRALSTGRVRASTITRFVVFAALVGLSFRAWVLWMAASLQPASVVDLVIDDAYYYLQLAYNAGLNARSTYDGITETNGYQPAWMALLIAMEAVLRLDKRALFIALQALILAIMAFPVLYCLKRRSDPFFVAMAAGLSASYASYPYVHAAGMETILFGPAMLAVCVAARKGLLASAPRASWLFALIVLIRVDALCLLVAYALPLAYHWWRAEGLGKATLRLTKFALPAFVTFATYSACNYIAYHESGPMSGLAKRVGAPLFSNWGIIFHYAWQAVPVLVAGSVVLFVELVWNKFRGGRFLYSGLGILSIALVVHYLLFATLTGWIPWPWYFYIYALMMVLLAARLIEIGMQMSLRASWRKPRVAQLVALAAITFPMLVFPGFLYTMLSQQLFENERKGGVPSGSFNRRNIADAMMFADSGEPLTVAIGDRAAGLGYWAPDNVNVFALEGLVSSKAYLQARLRGEGELWVRDNIRPRYLIVDREQLDLVRYGDQERYVVIEPIQGRIVFDHLMTYCFPKDAVVRRREGRDDQVMVFDAPAVRTTFDLSKAEPCTGPFAEHVQRTVFSPDSLRATGVGVEYAAGLGGELNARLERVDRALASRMRKVIGHNPFNAALETP